MQRSLDDVEARAHALARREPSLDLKASVLAAGEKARLAVARRRCTAAALLAAASIAWSSYESTHLSPPPPRVAIENFPISDFPYAGLANRGGSRGQAGRSHSLTYSSLAFLKALKDLS